MLLSTTSIRLKHCMTTSMGYSVCRRRARVQFGLISLTCRLWTCLRWIYASQKRRFGRLFMIHQTRMRRDPMDSPAYSTNRPGESSNLTLAAFNAFWSLDDRSLHLVNEALLVLLRKKSDADLITDYRPISLMHSVSKLITKCLASRLATFLGDLVRPNQTAFIRRRSIQNDFRTVQLSCKLLSKLVSPTMLMKVDIAKAFDSVSWPFLLEVMQHAGFSRRWTDWWR